jgi:hypothetical protein
VRRALLPFAVLLLAGCLQSSQAEVQGLFDFTEGTYRGDTGSYDLQLRGQVAVSLQGDVRDVRLEVGVVADCAKAPGEWGVVELGNLAAGSTSNLREQRSVPGPAAEQPQLKFVLTAEKSFGGGRKLDDGCGPLRVSP